MKNKGSKSDKPIYMMMIGVLLIMGAGQIAAWHDSTGGEDEPARPAHYIIVKEHKPMPIEPIEVIEVIADPDPIVGLVGIIPLEEDVIRLIHELSVKYELKLETVLAIIECESNFKADVIGITNDYGLMQISPPKIQDLRDVLNITNILDPYQNLNAGMYILSDLTEKYDGHEIFMAYNMGAAGMRKAVKDGHYSTAYSRKVVETETKWAELLGGR